MSLLDGRVVLDGESNNNNNGNRNRNNRNDRNRRPKQRSFSDDQYTFSMSSYLPEEEWGKVVEPEKPVEVKKDSRADVIYEFCKDFTDNVDNYRALQDVVIDEFPNAIKYIKQYYNTKNTSPMLIDALNKLIKLMCTTQFSKVIKSVLESRVWCSDGDDRYSEIWDSIGFGLSVTLETSHSRMHTDVIRTYAFDIIPRMYKAEISDICSRTGVTRDLANDLIIAIPVIGSEWNNANLETFYGRFLDKMLIHAEDNMDVLNWEVQGVLFDYIFGKDKTALKTIGKYLTSKPVPESESEVVNAVYVEFQKMLYAKLDEYDIDKIEYVFNYVSKFRKENPGAKTLFNSVKASGFDNVRKGLLSVMDKNPDSMNTLA